MKTPVRYQSRLLIRRSYKPARMARRRLPIVFAPVRPVTVLIANRDGVPSPERAATSDEIALSG